MISYHQFFNSICRDILHGTDSNILLLWKQGPIPYFKLLLLFHWPSFEKSYFLMNYADSNTNLLMLVFEIKSHLNMRILQRTIRVYSVLSYNHLYHDTYCRSHESLLKNILFLKWVTNTISEYIKGFQKTTLYLK